MMVLLQLVDSFTVKNSLVSAGMLPAVAKSIKGTYDRAQPLVQLGMVVAVSFSSTLLPTLTDALQKNQLARFRQIAKLLMRISATIAAAVNGWNDRADAGNQYVAFQHPPHFRERLPFMY